MRRKHTGDVPKQPLWADGRWFGITLTARMKLLVVALVLMTVLNSWSTYFNAQTIASGHRDRVKQEHDLACLLVEDTPPGNQLGDVIRERYRCPAFSNRSATPTPTPSTATRTVSAAPSTITATTTMTPPDGDSARPTPSARPSSSPTKPTKSRPRPQPPPNSHTPPIIPLPTDLCKVIPLICRPGGG